MTQSLRMCAVLVVAMLQASVRAEETFNRGLIAVVNDQGQVYLGWRVLKDDPADVAFNVYRRTDGAAAVKINARPLTGSTNLIDTAARTEKSNVWFVRPVNRGRELASSETASLAPNTPPNRVRSITLQGNYEFNRVGVCDLDGDGVFDYVIKQPGSGHGLDPGTIRPSPDTFKLEAYNGRTGAFMWRYDLGWNMNMGVWWTPFITGDFDGDGKAEVALKMAPYAATKEEAVIAEGGFVLEGPEYLVVLNGMTGREIARADWVEPPVRGQGAHGMHVYDVDGDGREEVALGSVVIDDNGRTLWTNRLGHPDVFYMADIIPQRPGLEIAYGYEDRQTINGIQVADARTGEMIWGHPDATVHIHDWGMFADIDAGNPGYEFYAAEQKRELGQFLYSARDGKLLSTADLGSITLNPVYWLDGPQKVYNVFSYRGTTTVLQKYKDPKPVDTLDGRIVAIADVLGDWREELILTVNGELRIATTTVPSSSRHVTLMQDPLYRNDVAHASMGYFYPPNTSYVLFPESFNRRSEDQK